MKYRVRYEVTEKHLAYRSCVVEADSIEDVETVFYTNCWDYDNDSELLGDEFLDTESDFEISNIQIIPE